jgi:hypothetical protein
MNAVGDIIDSPILPATEITSVPTLIMPTVEALQTTAPVWPLQHDMPSYYGNPASAGWLQANTIDVKCPWPLFMGKTPLFNILIHKRCAASLTRVLNNIWDAVGHDVTKIKELKYDQYSGSYNYRPIRGGVDLSCHAYAAALDFDDQDNQQHATKHLFTDQSLIVVKFKEEGAVWGGDWSSESVDAMHFQFARVH